ncbi:MAG: protein kinase domain-containing protein [Planctomycetota bacterium]|jgi:serine/threonine-protein kinase
MSNAAENNNKRAGKEEDHPTASFNGSVPGGQIGPFRIEQELGRGAVGVVYLAHDTKLDRPVAIKSLPAEVMANPKARSRFSREARVLASLNHPNIATIYDEFQETEDVAYLILEYVPGQTLAERIAKKPLKLQEALTIALQIAEAVAAAHEHDVIHRDLKPGNIKITPEGKVKVLDFGLAKAVGGEGLDQQSTVTEPGRVIGTPAYMSPEQARGKLADKRSDIWSFGCVLYEMLTGQLTFKGETVSDTLAGILEHEPSWQVLPESTPANIRSLLRHCLEKDSRRRLRDIGDAGIEISETLSQPATLPPITEATPIAARPLRWRLRIAWSLATSLCIVAAFFIGIIVRDSRPPSSPAQARPVTVFPMDIPPTQHLDINLFTSAVALSPDGTSLVYVASQEGQRWLFVRKMDELEPRLIPGTEDASYPFFSPDGESIAFLAGGKLKKVSLKSGDVQEVCVVLPVSFGGAWSPDGFIYFTLKPVSGLVKVSAEGGEPEPLTTPDPDKGEVGHYFPHLLPGGKMLLFTVASRALGFEDGRIAIVSLETGELHDLDVKGSKPQYTSSGHLVFARAGKLLAAPLDLERFELTGSAIPVREDVMTYPVSHFSLSSDGSLTYVPVVGGVMKNTLVWVNHEGEVEPLPSSIPASRYEGSRLSADGRWLAVTTWEQGSCDIYICDLTRSTLRRVTFNEEIDQCPIWVPNDERLTYSASVRGEKRAPDLFWVAPDGTDDAAELLFENELYAQFPTSWSHDGRYLAFVNELFETQFDIWVLDCENASQARPFLQEKFNEKAAVFHPNGDWIAYAADEVEPGRFEVYVQRFPDGGDKQRISTHGGDEPVWDPSGKALYYREGDKMMVVTVETDPKFSVSAPKELFSGRFESSWCSANYDITPDGKRFIMIKPEEGSEPTQVNIVLNWFEELKRLAPTGED